MRKYLQANWRPLSVLAVICMSMVALVVAICRHDIWMSVAGLPGYLFLLSLLHECGHVLGCKLNRSKLTGVCVVFFGVRQGKLYLLQQPKPESYCTFIRKERNGIVFLGGPVVSLVVTLLVLSLVVTTGSYVWLIYYLVSALHLLKNLIPGRNSDMQMLLKEGKKQKRD